jgi:hypothetical protein
MAAESPPAARSWEEVVAGLLAYAGPVSDDQLALAVHLSFPLDSRLPQPVAGALLRRQLRGSLHLDPARYPTQGQLDYVHDLAVQVRRRVQTPLDDQQVVDAWVKVFHAHRAVQALRKLRPGPGDIVQTSGTFGPYLAEISSISRDGRLNFRGGFGAGERPHGVVMHARASNPGRRYDKARYDARQAEARLRDPGYKISEADLRELRRWHASGAPTATDDAALSDALRHATDERPLQAVLARHPQILLHLVTSHHGGFVLPEAALGAHYRADFLIAGMTSLGLRWTLVELESPTASLTIADGQPSKQLRKGLQQIRDWREWLQENLDHARKPRRLQGLGLFGIRPHARALVIIGRGRLSTDTDVMRNQKWEEQQVDVRTYDWLVRETMTPRDMFGVLDLEHDDEAATPF